MKFIVKGNEHAYPVYMERGILARVGEYVDLRNRKVMIISDHGVPKAYGNVLLEQCDACQMVFPQGEGSKAFWAYQEILKDMLTHGFGRGDVLIALGGGMVGDLTGFAAATYMRGISYLNIPTTTLSQIDSSIGGKTAVNLEGVKNVAGAFHQPEAVFLDPQVLETLHPRHYANGMAEALKAGLIGDGALFELMEREDIAQNQEEIIHRANLVKKAIVEADETEQGQRKLLNFGHTLGHALESYYELGGLLHGECVALGMLPMLGSDELRERVVAVMEKLGLPVKADYDCQQVYELMQKDKKASGGWIEVVRVDEPGCAYLKKMPVTDLKSFLKRTSL